MRKNFFVAAALVAAAMASQAATVTVINDGFGDNPGAELTDASGGGASTLVVAGRTLSLEQIVPGVAASKSLIGLGLAPNVPDGLLNISNNTGVNSIAGISWTIGTYSGYTGGTFSIDVVINDLGSSTNTVLTLLDGSSNVLNTQAIPTIGTVNFGLSAADLAALYGGVLTMRVTGGTGFDVSFDNASLTINNTPEPGSLALLGLAALGMAVAKRRKA